MSLRLAGPYIERKPQNKQTSKTAKLLSIKMSLSTSLEDKVFEVKHDLVKLLGKKVTKSFILYSLPWFNIGKYHVKWLSVFPV